MGLLYSTGRSLAYLADGPVAIMIQRRERRRLSSEKVLVVLRARDPWVSKINRNPSGVDRT